MYNIFFMDKIKLLTINISKYLLDISTVVLLIDIAADYAC